MRLLIVLTLIVSCPVAAQVYKWTDENGNVHFGSQPPPGQQERVETRKGYEPSQDQARPQSHIMRQANQLDRQQQREDLERSRERYQERVKEIREDYENRPDYICQGAKNSLKSAEERWEAQKLQGATISEERYYEQLIRDRERHRDNVCR